MMWLDVGVQTIYLLQVVIALIKILTPFQISDDHFLVYMKVICGV